MVQVTKKLLREIEKVSYVYGPLNSTPLQLLQHFFESNTLNEFEERLKEWYNAIYFSVPKKIDYSVCALTAHQMACQLVNISWLFSRIAKKDLQQEIHSAFQQATHERQVSFNKDVIKDEINISVVNLRSIFDAMKPATCHRLLYKWLYHSLDKSIFSEELLIDNQLYENLLNMARNSAQLYNLMIGDRKVEIVAAEQTPNRIDPEPSMALHLGDAALNLFETTNPTKLNRSLRKMLVDYMLFNASGMPDDLKEVVNDYYWLADFLDQATDQFNKPN